MRPPAVGFTSSTAGASCFGSLLCGRPDVRSPVRLPDSRCTRTSHSLNRRRCDHLGTAAAMPMQRQAELSMACERSCGMASTSGRGRRHRWRPCCAASAEQPGDGVDIMQPELQDSLGSDSDSEADTDLGDLSENIESLNLEYLEYCRERFEIGDLVEIGLGANDLPAVYLHHPNGSELEVYLHGANITSWRKPDGADILFVRPDNSFDGFEPIKGGIPVVFPQYGRGVLPTNGLLRRMHWSIAATGVADPGVAADPAPSVALWTESDEFTLELWPHKFEAMYTISLMDHDEFPDNSIPNPVPERVQSDGAGRGSGMGQIGQWSAPGGEAGGNFEGEAQDDDPLQLRCVLEIANTDDEEFTFTSGLQTHFAVQPLGEYPQSSQLVRLLGLGGKHVLDYSGDPSHPRLTQQAGDYVHFGDRPVDSVFVDTDKTDVKLCPGDRTHHEILNRSGFRDTGAINPHTRMPDAYRHFVAVPSARVARPVTLQPGETWVGEMVIRAFDSMWERPLFEFDNEKARTNEAPPPMDNMQPGSQWR